MAGIKRPWERQPYSFYMDRGLYDIWKKYKIPKDMQGTLNDLLREYYRRLAPEAMPPQKEEEEHAGVFNAVARLRDEEETRVEQTRAAAAAVASEVQQKRATEEHQNDRCRRLIEALRQALGDHASETYADLLNTDLVERRQAILHQQIDEIDPSIQPTDAEVYRAVQSIVTGAQI